MKSRDLKPEEREKIRLLMSENPQKWSISSILDHNFGEICFFNDYCAALKISNFYFVEGERNADVDEKLRRHMTYPAILCSTNGNWEELFAADSANLKVSVMERTFYVWDKKRPHDLGLASKFDLPENMIIKKIEAEDACKIISLDWADTVFDAYDNLEHYLRDGFGFCIQDLEKQKIVSLCLSFATSTFGAELEIDTDPEYQRQGLAKAVTSRFIEESLNKNITPLWDASNISSAKVAKSLGFTETLSYKAIEIEEKQDTTEKT